MAPPHIGRATCLLLASLCSVWLRAVSPAHPDNSSDSPAPPLSPASSLSPHRQTCPPRSTRAPDRYARTTVRGVSWHFRERSQRPLRCASGLAVGGRRHAFAERSPAPALSRAPRRLRPCDSAPLAPPLWCSHSHSGPRSRWTCPHISAPVPD